LSDQWEVPVHYSEQAGSQQKTDHNSSQLGPDAQINVHRLQLYTDRAATEAVNCFANFLPNSGLAGAIEDEPQKIVGGFDASRKNVLNATGIADVNNFA
jgi:hypothetical protein